MLSLWFDFLMVKIKCLKITTSVFLSLLNLIFCVSYSQAQTPSDKSQELEIGAGLSLAGALLPWGTQFALQGAQAMDRRGERCAYPFAYEITTTAVQPIRIISTSISLNQRPLHQGQSVIVTPGEKKIIRGRIYLGNGINMLQFRVETANSVIEKTVSALVNGC
jgi:hypothetical protein